jgi:hypothetical protein
MSKNYLYTIITCLIIFTISLCAKDQILGWYDFDTAVAADNDSGISDITPDTNTSFDPTPTLNAHNEFLYLTGAIGPAASDTGASGVGLKVDSGILNDATYGNSYNIVDYAKPTNDSGELPDVNKSWKFGSAGVRGDFAIVNHSIYAFRLDEILFDAKLGSVNSPKVVEITYLAGAGSNAELKNTNTRTEVSDGKLFFKYDFDEIGVESYYDAAWPQDSDGVNYASGTLFSITKDIELDGTPQVGTAQVGTPAVGQPSDTDYVPASEDYVPASEDYVAATGNGGTPTGAASIGVESKLKYWVGTDVDETDLVIYPNQKAVFRITWSDFGGNSAGESYVDNLAFKGVFCAPYAKRPTVDPANADAIVGISNPYKNPNTDRVQARIFTNLEDGTATVDVYKTTDLTNADAWTLLLDDQTLVTGAATVLEDSATDPQSFYKVVAEGKDPGTYQSIQVSNSSDFTNNNFIPYSDLLQENSKLAQRFELVISNLVMSTGDDPTTTAVEPADHTYSLATGLINRSLANQTFTQDPAKKLFVGKNIFNVGASTYTRKVNLNLSAGDMSITSLKHFTINPDGTKVETYDNAEKLTFAESDGSGDDDGTEEPTTPSIKVEFASIFDSTNTFIPFAQNNTDTDSYGEITFVIEVVELPDGGGSFSIIKKQADGTLITASSPYVLDVGTNTFVVPASDNTNFRQVNLQIDPGTVKISSLTVNGVEYLNIDEDGIEQLTWDGTIRTLPNTRPGDNYSTIKVFESTDDDGSVRDTDGVTTSLTGSKGQHVVEINVTSTIDDDDTSISPSFRFSSGSKNGTSMVFPTSAEANPRLRTGANKLTLPAVDATTWATNTNPGRQISLQFNNDAIDFAINYLKINDVVVHGTKPADFDSQIDAIENPGATTGTLPFSDITDVDNSISGTWESKYEVFSDRNSAASSEEQRYVLVVDSLPAGGSIIQVVYTATGTGNLTYPSTEPLKIGLTTGANVITLPTSNADHANRNRKIILRVTDPSVTLTGFAVISGDPSVPANATIIHGEVAAELIDPGDIVAPTITLTGDNPLSLTVGDTFSEPGVSASDDVDGDITSLIATTSDVDTSVAGTYTVNYSVTDANGNTATATRTVTVAEEGAGPTVVKINALPDATVGSAYTSIAYFPLADDDGSVTNSEGNPTDMSGSKNAQRVDFNVVTLETGSKARFFSTYAGGAGNYGTAVNITSGFNKFELAGVSGANWNGKYRKLSIQFNNGSGAECIVDYMKINDVVLFGTVPADPTPPVITLVGESTVTLPVNGTFNDAGATADDDRDGDITGNIQIAGLPDTSTPGTYTVTYSVTDVGGNTVSVSRTVIVEDVAPTITVTGDNPLSLTVGDTFSDPGASAVDDLDGDISSQITETNDVDTSVVGTYTVTYSVTDSAGNAVTATRTVTVLGAGDNVAPTITVTGANPLSLNVGATFSDPGASASDDVDGDLTAQITSTNNVDTTVSGTYTVTYSVSDAAGNTGTATRTVAVATVPVSLADSDFISAGPNTTWQSIYTAVLKNEGTSSQDEQVVVINITSMPTGARYRFYRTNSSGSGYADGITDLQLGVNTITAPAKTFDRTVKIQFSSSAIEFDSFVHNGVEKVNLVAPTITLIGDNPLSLTVGDTFSDPGASAIDDVDGDLTAQITSTNDVDTSSAGSYTVTYSVSDSAGNAAATVTRTVTVAEPDLVAPTITVTGANPLSLNVGATFSDPGASATDDVDGDLTGSISTTSDVDTSVAGSYTVTYSVSDAAGNTSTATRTVTVAAVPVSLADSDFISAGPNTTWQSIYTAVLKTEGTSSRDEQVVVINITSMPTGARYRFYRTNSSGNGYADGITDLQLGVNTITAPAKTFDRTVKIQFSSSAIEFDSFVHNGVEKKTN